MQNITKESLKALYEQVVILKKLKPWEFMLESQVFVLIHPITQENVYCMITGSEGMDLAINMYIGDRSFAKIYKVIKREIPTPALMASYILSGNMLKCGFEDKEYLVPEERDVLKELGLRFRGAQAWPICRIGGANKVPTTITDEESCQIFTQLLEGAIYFLKHIKATNLPIEDIMDAKELPTVIADEQGYKVICKPFEFTNIKVSNPFSYNDELMLKRIRTLKTKGLQVDLCTMLMPFPIDESAVFPQAMMAMNRRGETIFATVLTVEEEEQDRKQELIDEFAKAMLEHGVKPRTICVEQEEDYALLEDFCQKAQITLKKQPINTRLYETVESFFEEIVGEDFEDEEDWEIEDEDFEGEVEALGNKFYENFRYDIENFVRSTVKELLRTPMGKKYKGETREELEGTIDMFVHITYELFEQLPFMWSSGTVEKMFTVAIPQYVTIPEDQLTKVPQQLIDYFNYLGEYEGIVNSQELVRAVEKYQSQMFTLAKDSSNWNTSKRIGMEVAGEGTAPGQVATILQKLQTTLSDQEFDELAGNIIPRCSSTPKKIGRNEPCLCGSGKKYKKCCSKNS